MVKNYINQVFIVLVVATFNGCEEKNYTSVSGQIVNWGSREPIDSVLVELEDGIGGSGSFGVPFQTTSDLANVTYTGQNGEFSVSLTGKYQAFLSLGKKRYNWDGGGDGDNVKGFSPGNHLNVILTMKAEAYFNGIFKKSQNAAKADSLFIRLLYDDGTTLSTSVGNSPIEPYVGTGPFRFGTLDHGTLITGDTFLRFRLKFKSGSNWIEKLDSVFVNRFTVYKDTVFY